MLLLRVETRPIWKYANQGVAYAVEGDGLSDDTLRRA